MYGLDGKQQKIVNRASSLADTYIRAQAQQVDAEGVFPTEAVQALREEGFLGLSVPREFGGMGQGLRVMAAVLEEIAQRCASTAMVFLMHLCGIACYAARPQKTRDFLQAAAQGRHLTTLAWSERGSRSNFWAPVSRERRQDGKIFLTAEKSWVTSAGYADGYVVSTQWAEARGPTDVMLYVVLRSDPGIEVAGRWNGLGMRGNASAPMRLVDVAVGEDRALTERGNGLEVMLGQVLPVFQLGCAAISVGIAEAAVQATQQHLVESRFEHTGSRLADLPTLRARLGQMRLETDRARAHLAAAIEAVERPGPATQRLVLEIKASAAEAAIRVTDLAMRTCGGASFSRHLGIERHFRDARASEVMAPTSDHALEFIGRQLCGMELLA